MKKISIRLKITLWFSAALIIVVSFTYLVILSISNQVIQKTIRDALIETVENNVDEIEFFSSIDDVDFENDVDHFVEYRNGYLEIDDDFLDSVNEVYTALYRSDGVMLYGENPIIMNTADYKFINAQVQQLSVQGVLYYMFDRELYYEGLEGLWLRGVVSEKQGDVQLENISKLSLLLLPLLVLVSAIVGYMIAGRMLRPIHKMSVTAAQITQGNDLKKRIEIGNGRDELHQLADSFNAMLGRMEKAFESERRFTSDVSHELRTPMSVIMAQCEYSLENQCTADEYVQSLEVIQRQGNKMSKLIHDMLTFTRLEMQTDKYEKKEVDFSELVRSVCEDMALIREKDIVLTWEVPDGISITGNEGLLARLLTNLISNAYRYGKENGYIHVVLKQETTAVLLEVSDNGIGISAEEQEKIFHRFYQADHSHSDTGTGLGLAMAAEIAQFHNGEISVKSSPGIGSSFYFHIPKENNWL